MNVFPAIVVVSCNYTEVNGIIEWCWDNNIDVTFRNHWSQTDIDFKRLEFGSFEIQDEQQRAWFALRWL